MGAFARRSIVLTVSALCLALAGAAVAKNRTIAPPGNSGIGQYVESVPTAGGSQPTNTIHPHGAAGGGLPGGPGSGSGSGGGGGAVSAATARALGAQGADGRAAANLARATAPGGTSRAGAAAGSGTAGASSNTGSSGGSGGGSSPFSSVFKALTGSSGGGLGPILPAVLIVSVIGAGALALRRRRTT